MKSLSRKVLSIVISLSILMTVCCVMATTASAATKTFEIISATATKQASDMAVTKTGTSGEFEVVNTSTLTGGTAYTGNATDAYMASTDTGIAKDGFMVETNGASTDFSDFYDVRTNCYLDMWVWVSDTAVINNLVIRIYSADGMTDNGSGSFCEIYPYQITTKSGGYSVSNGWTHVSVKMASWNTAGSKSPLFDSGKTIKGVSLHEHSGSTGAYSFAIASLAIVFDDGVSSGPSSGASSTGGSSIVSDTSSVAGETDLNTVGTTIVSPNVTKSMDKVAAIGSATVSIVDSSSLTGGTAGVPAAKAYLVSGVTAKGGIVIDVENPDWTTPSSENLQGYGVNVWLWISDYTKLANFVSRYFAPDLRNGIDGWTYQVTSNMAGNAVSSSGWINMTFWFPASGDFDHRATVGDPSGNNIAQVVFEDHSAGAAYDFAIASARLVKSGDEGKSWGTGAATQTGDSMNVALLVTAVLFAAIAASATVYFGKKYSRG